MDCVVPGFVVWVPAASQRLGPARHGRFDRHRHEPGTAAPPSTPVGTRRVGVYPWGGYPPAAVYATVYAVGTVYGTMGAREGLAGRRETAPTPQWCIRAASVMALIACPSEPGAASLLYPAGRAAVPAADSLDLSQRDPPLRRTWRPRWRDVRGAGVSGLPTRYVCRCLIPSDLN
jgi:hypothetical protein